MKWSIWIYGLNSLSIWIFDTNEINLMIIGLNQCICCTWTYYMCYMHNLTHIQTHSRVSVKERVGVNEQYEYERCNKTNHIWLQSYWSVKFVGLPINSTLVLALYFLFVYIKFHLISISMKIGLTFEVFVCVCARTCARILWICYYCVTARTLDICFVDFSISKMWFFEFSMAWYDTIPI